MITIVKKLARALDVVGLMNVQFAYRDEALYVLEVNPRASRTIPYVSKATGVDWVDVATRCILGVKLADQGVRENLDPGWYAVKEVVFPFSRFEGVNPFLGPEMRSTGEVMGIARTFSEAYSKALYAAGTYLPSPGRGNVFISVNEHDKPRVVPIARELLAMGFALIATPGTQRHLEEEGIPADLVHRVNRGRPNIIDRMKNGEVQLLINTPLGRESYIDEKIVVETAYRMGLPLITTLSAARACLGALASIGRNPLQPVRLQDLSRPDPDGS